MAVKSLEEEIGDNYKLGYECGLDQLKWFWWQRIENPIQND